MCCWILINRENMICIFAQYSPFHAYYENIIRKRAKIENNEDRNLNTLPLRNLLTN